MSESVARRRLTADDRRRQLLGIGLAKLVDKPIQDLSVDEVAAEAGISRGLLFHYFPTKRAFYVACVEAAGRRILRNTAPDPALPPAEQVAAMVRRYVEQIDRRRAFYLSLVHGTGGGDVAVVEVYDAIREEATARVVGALGIDPVRRSVVHAWWAYVEDRALSWSAAPARRRTLGLDRLVDECVSALHALLAIG
ncbi:MAG: TetR/AcrR family transcriptional regulator [Nocardioidaceae bacterium]